MKNTNCVCVEYRIVRVSSVNQDSPYVGTLKTQILMGVVGTFVCAYAF